jgi:hypothetical protein
MEALHICGGKAAQDQSASSGNQVERLFGPSGKLKTLSISILLLSIATLLYAVPTVLELLAAQRLDPWFGVILPGDIIGCALLVAVFRMHRTGLSLYLLLTACEGSLYAFHIVTANALPWMVDIVPTLAVTAIILRVRLASAARLIPLS